MILIPIHRWILVSGECGYVSIYRRVVVAAARWNATRTFSHTGAVGEVYAAAVRLRWLLAVAVWLCSWITAAAGSSGGSGVGGGSGSGVGGSGWGVRERQCAELGGGGPTKKEESQGGEVSGVGLGVGRRSNYFDLLLMFLIFHE